MLIIVGFSINLFTNSDEPQHASFYKKYIAKQTNKQKKGEDLVFN